MGEEQNEEWEVRVYFKDFYGQGKVRVHTERGFPSEWSALDWAHSIAHQQRALQVAPNTYIFVTPVMVVVTKGGEADGVL